MESWILYYLLLILVAGYLMVRHPSHSTTNPAAITVNSSPLSCVGLTITQTASLLIALSNNDWISGSTNNKDAVLVSLDTVFAQNPDIST